MKCAYLYSSYIYVRKKSFSLCKCDGLLIKWKKQGNMEKFTLKVLKKESGIPQKEQLSGVTQKKTKNK